MNLSRRPRRLRELAPLKSMLKEFSIQKEDLILPLFISDNCSDKESIDSMPEVFRWSINSLINQMETWLDIGINTFALFPCIKSEKKCNFGNEILDPESICYKAAKKIKEKFNNVTLIADLALDPFTDHGHDGVLDQFDKVDNDRTIEILRKAALIAAKSGFDIVAPSDMMEIKLDEQVGADILLVKPAEPYLDVIKSAKETSSLPIAAYQVSGEYSRIWAASKLGWLDLDKCAHESLLSIKRAGADMILTYFAERIAKLI